MKLYFWQKWIIRYTMRKLKIILPYLSNYSYADLEKLGIADISKDLSSGELSIIPD